MAKTYEDFFKDEDAIKGIIENADRYIKSAKEDILLATLNDQTGMPSFYTPKIMIARGTAIMLLAHAVKILANKLEDKEIDSDSDSSSDDEELNGSLEDIESAFEKLNDWLDEFLHFDNEDELSQVDIETLKKEIENRLGEMYKDENGESPKVVVHHSLTDDDKEEIEYGNVSLKLDENTTEEDIDKFIESLKALILEDDEDEE